MQPSEEIKSRLDVVDVIREYVPLKNAGSNWRGLCPFHRENSPSFMVSSEKQIWHCFGCGKGGDVISFIKEIEGIEFIEALRILAKKAGVELKSFSQKTNSKNNRLLDILDLSAKYFHKSLLESKEAEAARQYLNDRRLTGETIEDWLIGYSPESWERLLEFLKSRGFSDEEIFLSGMSIKRERMSGYYSRFRGRIMFPINDLNGNVVGFSARVLPGGDEKMGKYINSPQTPVYDKSRIIFGLDKAKFFIKSEDIAILVEGQIDVLTAYQHGFKNIVASSGTALTEAQLNLLKRYSNNISLSFDMDKAGEMAADRGIRTAMKMDMNIKVIEVPNGKDPDECIKNNPEEWRNAVLRAKPMMQYYFDNILKNLDLTKIDHKREAARKILPIINDLGSRIEQDFWLKKLSELISINEFVLRETLLNINKKKEGVNSNINKKETIRVVEKNKIGREEKLSELLLAISLKFPDLLPLLVKRLPIEALYGEDKRDLYRKFIIYYNNNAYSENDNFYVSEKSVLDYENFKNWLLNISEKEDTLDQEVGLLGRLSFLGDEDFSGLEFENARTEALGMIMALKKSYLNLKMKELERRISEAEKSNNKNFLNDYLKEFKVLSEELRNIKI